jgi:hypothetical protein
MSSNEYLHRLMKKKFEGKYIVSCSNCFILVNISCGIICPVCKESLRGERRILYNEIPPDWEKLYQGQ